ncbi:MAG: DNA methyltransferase, partial [Elioraea sp.]|nr:DNA methyltransferase [Elioraea sp.]
EIGAGPPFNGLLEKRGGALIDCDRDVLAIRTRAYFDPALSWEEAKPRIGGLAENAGRFPARRTREELVGNRGRRFEEQAILRYHLRPFNVRSAYVMPDRPLWNEPRPELLRQLPTAGNFLATRPAAARAPKACP